MQKMESNLNNYRNFENQCQDYERKNALLNKEVERLNKLVRGQNDELTDFRTKYTKVESSLKEYREIEHRVREFESKIALLTQEIERLNNLLRARNTDIEALEN